MPISGAEFEEEEVPTGPPIFLFLRRDRDQAYTVEEIVEGMRADGIDVIHEVVEAVISNLVTARVVERRTVRNRVYYRAAPEAGRQDSGG